jgi:hypothetical protein
LEGGCGAFALEYGGRGEAVLAGVGGRTDSGMSWEGPYDVFSINLLFFKEFFNCQNTSEVIDF